jgi:hypothetical protein
MRSPKSLHNLQHDEGGNYMAEVEETCRNKDFAYLDQKNFFNKKEEMSQSTIQVNVTSSYNILT